MLKRRLKLLGKILLALVVLLVVFLLFERFRGQISLALYERELIRKGEKLSVSEIIPQLASDVENGSPEIWRLISAIPEGKVLVRHLPPIAKSIAPGRALVGFREPNWTDTFIETNPFSLMTITCRWEEVESELNGCRQTLVQVFSTLKRSAFDNKLDYSRGADMRVPHWQQVSRISGVLGASVQLSLRANRHSEACDTLVMMLDLPRLLDRDGVAEFKRRDIASRCHGLTWEGLQAGIWSEEELVRIQEAWERLSFMTNLVFGFRVDRVSHDNDWDRYWRPNEFAVYGRSPNKFEELCNRVVHRVWSFSWSHQDQKRYWQGIQRVIELSELGVETKSYLAVSSPLEEFDFEFARLEKDKEGEIKKRFSPYDALRFPPSDYIVSCCIPEIQRTMRTETERSIAVTAIALRRCELRNGKMPQDLNALIPDFVSVVPTDFMDGTPIKYRLKGNGDYLLYSVATDGQDDEGNPLWTYGANASSRQDWVWPTPAPPEEVEAARKKAH